MSPAEQCSWFGDEGVSAGGKAEEVGLSQVEDESTEGESDC